VILAYESDCSCNRYVRHASAPHDGDHDGDDDDDDDSDSDVDNDSEVDGDSGVMQELGALLEGLSLVALQTMVSG
jgi:hypothetical protein